MLYIFNNTIMHAQCLLLKDLKDINKFVILFKMNVGNNTHFNGTQYNGYSSFHDGKQIKANTIIESEI